MTLFAFATDEGTLAMRGVTRPIPLGSAARVNSGDLVVTSDNRMALFVCIDMIGPHHMVWLSYNGDAEFRRMLANAEAANATA